MARTDYYAIQTPTLQATSQAIRTVNGTVGTIAPEDYPDLISAMHSSADYDNVMAQLIEETASGAVVSFADGANNLPCKEIVCSINPTGHTELNLYQRGTNLWDEEWEVGYYSNGEKADNSARIRSKDHIPVKAGATYRFYCNTQKYNSWISVQFYDKDKVFISNATVNANATFTVPADIYFINISTNNNWAGQDYEGDFSINYPSTDTAYHAYAGTTHTIDFGQTVYGGELIIAEGEFDKIVTSDTPQETIILPTKTQVNTLLGANNLYHDCNGNIEVTYRANGELYVQTH